MPPNDPYINLNETINLVLILKTHLELTRCMLVGFRVDIPNPSNSLMLFVVVSLFNELYCHPKIQLAIIVKGHSLLECYKNLPIFKMLQPST
jgi:hypothetical protein